MLYRRDLESLICARAYRNNQLAGSEKKNNTTRGVKKDGLCERIKDLIFNNRISQVL
jgi:hypothetical protein